MVDYLCYDSTETMALFYKDHNDQEDWLDNACIARYITITYNRAARHL